MRKSNTRVSFHYAAVLIACISYVSLAVSYIKLENENSAEEQKLV